MTTFKHGMTTEERYLTATIDHKVCKRLGGQNADENYVISCARCNQLKGMVPYDVFKIFASMVLIPYPDLPLNILKGALQDYTMMLLEAVIGNKKAMRNASSVTLLNLSETVNLYEKGRKR